MYFTHQIGRLLLGLPLPAKKNKQKTRYFITYNREICANINKKLSSEIWKNLIRLHLAAAVLGDSKAGHTGTFNM